MGTYLPLTTPETNSDIARHSSQAQTYSNQVFESPIALLHQIKMPSHLRLQSSIEEPISANATYQTSPTLPPAKKQKMSLTQTYYVASTARSKLGREASRADHNLRLLVGHANLLDQLMVDLADAEKEQEAWFNQTVQKASKPEQPKHIQWLNEYHHIPSNIPRQSFWTTPNPTMIRTQPRRRPNQRRWSLMRSNERRSLRLTSTRSQTRALKITSCNRRNSRRNP